MNKMLYLHNILSYDPTVINYQRVKNYLYFSFLRFLIHIILQIENKNLSKLYCALVFFVVQTVIICKILNKTWTFSNRNLNRAKIFTPIREYNIICIIYF